MFVSKSKKSGMGMVEIIVASSIISITLLVLVSVYSAVARYSVANVLTLKATQLSEEGVEVLKYLKDSGYTENLASLTLGDTYHLYWDVNVGGGSWTATTSNILLEDKYEIDFVLYPVYRDSNFDVVSSGGTVDPDSLRAVVNVIWHQYGSTNTKTKETYLFNIFDN